MYMYEAITIVTFVGYHLAWISKPMDIASYISLLYATKHSRGKVL